MTEAQLERIGKDACSLADALVENENVPFHHSVIRNRRNGYCRYHNGTYQLIFSWDMLKYCYESGYPWWRINAQVWPDKVAGMRGVYRHVLHEVAHVRQIRFGEQWRGSVHNRFFVRRLRELVQETSTYVAY